MTLQQVLLNDWDIKNFDDFEDLPRNERQWLIDNGLVSPYWCGIESERLAELGE